MSSGANGATLAPAAESNDGSLAVLGVTAAGESYGFPLSAVHEILTPPPVTQVPLAPAHVLGVITVRGQIVTVVDFRRLVGMPPSARDEVGTILLVNNSEELIGVAVDQVIQVHRLRREQIERAGGMGADLACYVLGIGRVQRRGKGETMMVLVDPVTLLGG